MKKYLFTFVLFVTISVFGVTDDNIRTYTERNSNNSFSLFADNLAYCPIYINITFSILDNLSATVEIPYETVIPPRSFRNKLFDLNPINRREATSLSYRYYYNLGDPVNVTPDTSFLYLFPFAPGERFRVMQGINGTFSHFDESQYAIDFDMPIGTPIHAARDGIVVEIKQDSNIGGNDRRFINDGNYILIYHSDGTFGNYVHFRYNGVAVTLGQFIEAGQLIGYSGNTGFSSAPHLHFAVCVPQRNASMTSIPFKFITNNLEGVIPREGEFYESFYP